MSVAYGEWCHFGFNQPLSWKQSWKIACQLLFPPYESDEINSDLICKLRTMQYFSWEYLMESFASCTVFQSSPDILCLPCCPWCVAWGYIRRRLWYASIAPCKWLSFLGLSYPSLVQHQYNCCHFCLSLTLMLTIFSFMSISKYLLSLMFIVDTMVDCSPHKRTSNKYCKCAGRKRP